MEREVILTKDGSSTLHIAQWNESYHSFHGAVQEAIHVFIQSGFQIMIKQEIRILEMGYGTGLNAFLTFLENQQSKKKIHYTAIEKYPIIQQEFEKLNYINFLPEGLVHKNAYHRMFASHWEQSQQIDDNFLLQKMEQDFLTLTLPPENFDLIYFDAFGARVQPDLWTYDMFNHMHALLMPEGVLVTYAAKGSVRRAMMDIGFSVERLQGPPGKREMLRATKR